jgi:hypothetical protein
MADFSEVKDKDGKVCGLWISDPKDANDPVYLAVLMMRLGVPQDACARVMAGGGRVVANTVDNKGGCFVMFDSAPPADSPNADCSNCRTKAFSTSEFEQECEKAGFVKDAASGSFKMKVGGLAGFGNSVFSQLANQQESQQATFNKIENQRGYRCRSCRAVYCMKCLYASAPAHSRGGKACPKCGDTFEHLE